MKQLFAIFLICLLTAFAPDHQPHLKKIFNGKNLKGWVAPPNNVWWTAGKGILFVKSTAEKKGSILWTEKNTRISSFRPISLWEMAWLIPGYF
jgi:hypothetical protein